MKKILVAIAFVGAFLVSSLSFAQDADPIAIELVNGGYSGNTDIAVLGVKVSMRDGWHTYWKTAGEGGFPPEFDFRSSSNISTTEIKFPAPEVITSSDPAATAQTSGYRHEVLFPILAHVNNPSASADVRLKLRIYACKDFCTAFEREMEVKISSHQPPTYRQNEVVEWLRKVPKGKSEKIKVVSAEAMQSGAIAVDVNVPDASSNFDIHIGNDYNAPYSVQKSKVNDEQLRFVVTPASEDFGKSNSLEIVVTGLGESLSHAVDTPKYHEELSLAVLTAALVGGLILNVMPCVFPVLSLKLLSLTRGDIRIARKSFIASGIGIVLSFLALGSIVSALKAAGIEVGWGIQFQSPLFLAIMAFVTLVFATSLMGRNGILLPSRLATMLTNLTHGEGVWPSVSQGFVATLLATPCTAPMVGTAVGFAFSGSMIDTVAIMTLMGLGMASPYLILGSMPKLSALVPKPGAWMNIVKLVMALSLFSTSGWLIYLFATSLSLDGAYTAMILIAIMSVEFLLLRTHSSQAVAVVVLMSLLWPSIVASRSDSNESGIQWQVYSDKELLKEMERGEIVVVNATADWCLTCKINKRTTWDSPDVIAVSRNLAMLEADWTKPNPEIQRLLKTFNRYGIPLTAVYCPNSPSSILLPELTTAASFKNAIKCEK